MSEKKTNISGRMTMIGGALLVLGAVGVGIAAVTSGTDAGFWKDFFFGWFFVTCIVLGCVGLQLLHHTVRGKWGAPLLRVWEAGGGPFMIFAMLGFLAVFWGAGQAGIFDMSEIYSWWTAEARAVDRVYKHRELFANPTMYIALSAIVLVGFALIIGRLQAMMRKEERSGDKELDTKRNWFAPPMLAVYVIGITLVTTMWGMTLDPHWFSTMYGPWVMVGCAVAALSFSAAITNADRDKKPYAGRLTAGWRKDVGNLLLAFSMLWAYFSLSQYLIIWSPNIPEFTTYYLARSGGGLWGWSNWGAANIVVAFFLPFLLLLMPSVKRSGMAFTFVAIWIFAARLFDTHYILSPSLGSSTSQPGIGQIGFVLLFLGFWMVGSATLLRRKPLVTDPHPYKSFAGKDDSALEAAHG